MAGKQFTELLLSVRDRWDAFAELLADVMRNSKRWLGIVFLILTIGVILGAKGDLGIQGWPGLIVGAVLGALAALFFDWLPDVVRAYVDKLPTRRVLGALADSDCTIHVMSFWRDMSDPEHFQLRSPRRLKVNENPASIVGPEFVVGEGDARALTFLYHLLLLAQPNVNRIMVNHLPDFAVGAWSSHIICIGAANQKTQDILEHFHDLPYKFTDNNSAIIRGNNSDKTEVTEQTESGEVRLNYQWAVRMKSGVDYGIILKLHDQFSDGEHVCLVVAGLGPDGTSGAAYYLLKHCRDIRPKLDGNGEFALLVEVNIGSYQTGRQVTFEHVAELSQIA